VAAGLIVAGFGTHRLSLARGDVPSIEDIMNQVNKKKSGLHEQVATALNASTVNWGEVQKQTKQYAVLAEFLGKNDPPKGSTASWEKLTKAYADDAKALHTAAESKNKSALNATIKKLSADCMGCHQAHRVEAANPAAGAPSGVTISDPTSGGVWPKGSFFQGGTGKAGASIRVTLFAGKVTPGENDGGALSAATAVVGAGGKWSVRLSTGSRAIVSGTVCYDDETNGVFWYESFGGK